MILRLPPAIRRLLVVVPAVIASFGVQSLYVYFTHPKPLEVSIGQLISNPPRAIWVRVTGGRINLLEAAVSEAGFARTIDRVFVPIHQEDREAPTISVLLLSTDPVQGSMFVSWNRLDGRAKRRREPKEMLKCETCLLLLARPLCS